MKKFALPAALITLLVGVALFFFLPGKTPESPVTPSAVDITAPPAANEPAIRYPIAEPPAPTEGTAAIAPEQPPAPALPLPEMPGIDSADAVLRELLALLGGKKSLIDLFNIDHFVQRVVVSVDNLTRKELAIRQLPVKSASGLFLVQGDVENQIISPYNARRYATYLELLDQLDSKQLTSLYMRFYPLFQKAYVDLGKPKGYFNDRLIEVIDHLLETPDIQQPIRLERPGVLYRFADPDLENRSAGQKILLRIGPDNAQKLKGKLKEWRELLTAHSQSGKNP